MADGGHLFAVRVRTNEHLDRETVEDWLRLALRSLPGTVVELDADEREIWIEALCIQRGRDFVDYTLPDGTEKKLPPIPDAGD